MRPPHPSLRRLFALGSTPSRLMARLSRAEEPLAALARDVDSPEGAARALLRELASGPDWSTLGAVASAAGREREASAEEGPRRPSGGMGPARTREGLPSTSPLEAGVGLKPPASDGGSAAPGRGVRSTGAPLDTGRQAARRHGDRASRVDEGGVVGDLARRAVAPRSGPRSLRGGEAGRWPPQGEEERSRQSDRGATPVSKEGARQVVDRESARQELDRRARRAGVPEAVHRPVGSRQDGWGGADPAVEGSARVVLDTAHPGARGPTRDPGAEEAGLDRLRTLVLRLEGRSPASGVRARVEGAGGGAPGEGAWRPMGAGESAGSRHAPIRTRRVSSGGPRPAATAGSLGLRGLAERVGIGPTADPTEGSPAVDASLTAEELSRRVGSELLREARRQGIDVDGVRS